MSDARDLAAWRRIRAGLALLVIVWGIHLVLTVVNRFAWESIASSFSTVDGDLARFDRMIDLMSGVSAVAFTAVGVALAVVASRLTRFPVLTREVKPGAPYRGSRDAGPAIDPGLDRLAVVLVAALGLMAASRLASYVVPTLFPPAYVPGPSPRGINEAIRTLHIAAAAIAGVVFTLWASRAALVTARPHSSELLLASYLGLALRGGLALWGTLIRAGLGDPWWTRWVALALEMFTTGVLIALAFGVLEAVREQPRSQVG